MVIRSAGEVETQEHEVAEIDSDTGAEGAVELIELIVPRRAGIVEQGASNILETKSADRKTEQEIVDEWEAQFVRREQNVTVVERPSTKAAE